MFIHLLVGGVKIITFIFGHELCVSRRQHSLVKGLIDNISRWEKKDFLDPKGQKSNNSRPVYC